MLLHNGVLQPQQLAVLLQVFDRVWEATRLEYADSEQMTELGQLRLADAILRAYRSGATDANALKTAAIEAMRRWN